MILSIGMRKSIESHSHVAVRTNKIYIWIKNGDPQSMGDNDAYPAANIYKR
jgi:hypothetical protein